MSRTSTDWFAEYFERYQRALADSAVHEPLVRIKEMFTACSARRNRVILAGNGGSAAIADHCAVDLTKNAGIHAHSVAGAAWVTCFANDYGYEHWLSETLTKTADTGDVVVLISSSGRSANIVNAARTALDMGLDVITLSGFEADNPLRSLGRVNLWVDSRAYNVVELTHQIWLLGVCDSIIGSAEYGA